MDLYLDFYNLLTYDYAGFSDHTEHTVNLYSLKVYPYSTSFFTDAVIQDYINIGIILNKIVLNMPLYGCVFQQTNDMRQPFQSISDDSFKPGI